MSKLSKIINAPAQDTAFVVLNGVKYVANEVDIRYLQVVVHNYLKGDKMVQKYREQANGIIEREMGLKVYDKYGKQMIFNAEGCFCNKFGGNIFDLNCSLAFKLL